MLVAAHAVHNVRQVHHRVEAAFGRRHHFLGFARHHHPLALLAVADHVRFQAVGAVVLLVFRDHVLDVVERLEVGVGENARASRVGARADHLARVHQVLVGEHIVGAGLRVAAGRHSEGEVCEEAPVLHVEHPAADLEPVGMDIHEAGKDGGPRNIHDFGARRHRHCSVTAEGGDAVVFHHDVGVRNDFVSAHRDNLRAAQYDHSLRVVAGHFHVDAVVLGRRPFHFFLLFRARLGFWLGGARLLLLIGFLLRLEGNGRESLAEKCRAHRPGDGLAAVGPCQVIRADFGELFQRHVRRIDVDGGRLAAHFRRGHQVKLRADSGERPVAIRADAHVLGGRAFFVGRIRKPDFADHAQVSAPVRAVISDGHQPALRVDVHAVLLLAEMRVHRASRGHDQACYSALRRKPDQIHVG